MSNSICVLNRKSWLHSKIENRNEKLRKRKLQLPGQQTPMKLKGKWRQACTVSHFAGVNLLARYSDSIQTQLIPVIWLRQQRWEFFFIESSKQFLFMLFFREVEAIKNDPITKEPNMSGWNIHQAFAPFFKKKKKKLVQSIPHKMFCANSAGVWVSFFKSICMNGPHAWLTLSGFD